MNKKIKFLILFAVLSLTCCTTGMLVGCSKGVTHTHSYTVEKYDETSHWLECPQDGARSGETKHTLVYDSDEDDHWQHCTGCEYKTEYIPHDFSNGNCVCGETAPEYGTVKGKVSIIGKDGSAITDYSDITINFKDSKVSANVDDNGNITAENVKVGKVYDIAITMNGYSTCSKSIQLAQKDEEYDMGTVMLKYLPFVGDGSSWVTDSYAEDGYITYLSGAKATLSSQESWGDFVFKIKAYGSENGSVRTDIRIPAKGGYIPVSLVTSANGKTATFEKHPTTWGEPNDFDNRHGLKWGVEPYYTLTAEEVAAYNSENGVEIAVLRKDTTVYVYLNDNFCYSYSHNDLELKGQISIELDNDAAMPSKKIYISVSEDTDTAIATGTTQNVDIDLQEVGETEKGEITASATQYAPASKKEITYTVNVEDGYMLSSLLYNGVEMIESVHEDGNAYVFTAVARKVGGTQVVASYAPCKQVSLDLSIAKNSDFDLDGKQITLKRANFDDVTATVSNGKVHLENITEGTWAVYTNLFGQNINLGNALIRGEGEKDISSLIASNPSVIAWSADDGITYKPVMHGADWTEFKLSTPISVNGGNAYYAFKVEFGEETKQLLSSGKCAFATAVALDINGVEYSIDVWVASVKNSNIFMLSYSNGKGDGDGYDWAGGWYADHNKGSWQFDEAIKNGGFYVGVELTTSGKQRLYISQSAAALMNSASYVGEKDVTPLSGNITSVKIGNRNEFNENVSSSVITIEGLGFGASWDAALSRFGANEVTVKQAEHGTITINKDTFTDGETITVTATPQSGYSPKAIYVNGVAISAISSGGTARIKTAEIVAYGKIEITAEFGPIGGLSGDEHWTIDGNTATFNADSGQYGMIGTQDAYGDFVFTATIHGGKGIVNDLRIPMGAYYLPISFGYNANDRKFLVETHPTGGGINSIHYSDNPEFDDARGGPWERYNVYGEDSDECKAYLAGTEMQLVIIRKDTTVYVYLDGKFCFSRTYEQLDTAGEIKFAVLNDVNFYNKVYTFNITESGVAEKLSELSTANVVVNKAGETEKGTITASAQTYNPIDKSTITYTITVNDGYKIKSVVYNGKDVTSSIEYNAESDAYIYTAVAVNVGSTEITVTFAEGANVDVVLTLANAGQNFDGRTVTLKRTGFEDITGTITNGAISLSSVREGAYNVYVNNIFGQSVLLGSVNIDGNTATKLIVDNTAFVGWSSSDEITYKPNQNHGQDLIKLNLATPVNVGNNSAIYAFKVEFDSAQMERDSFNITAGLEIGGHEYMFGLWFTSNHPSGKDTDNCLSLYALKIDGGYTVDGTWVSDFPKYNGVNSDQYGLAMKNGCFYVAMEITSDGYEKIYLSSSAATLQNHLITNNGWSTDAISHTQKEAIANQQIQAILLGNKISNAGGSAGIEVKIQNFGFGTSWETALANFANTVTKAACENGSVSVDKETYTLGEEITVTATPASGYAATVIYVNGEEVESAYDASTKTMTAKIKAYGAVQISAKFELISDWVGDERWTVSGNTATFTADSGQYGMIGTKEAYGDFVFTATIRGGRGVVNDLRIPAGEYYLPISFGYNANDRKFLVETHPTGGGINSIRYGGATEFDAARGGEWQRYNDTYGEDSDECKAYLAGTAMQLVVIRKDTTVYVYLDGKFCCSITNDRLNTRGQIKFAVLNDADHHNQSYTFQITGEGVDTKLNEFANANIVLETAGSTDGGEITASATTYNPAAGTEITYTITVNDGYKIKSVVYDGKDVTDGIIYNSGSYVYTAVALRVSSTEITVTFEEGKINVTTPVNTRGTVTTDKTECTVDDVVTITATPNANSGYLPSAIYVNGQEVVSEYHSDTNTRTATVTASTDLTVTAVFGGLKTLDESKWTVDGYKATAVNGGAGVLKTQDQYGDFVLVATIYGGAGIRNDLRIPMAGGYMPVSVVPTRDGDLLFEAHPTGGIDELNFNGNEQFDKDRFNWGVFSYPDDELQTKYLSGEAMTLTVIRQTKDGTTTVYVYLDNTFCFSKSYSDLYAVGEIVFAVFDGGAITDKVFSFDITTGNEQAKLDELGVPAGN